MKTKDFLKEANKIHNSKYSYNITSDIILKRNNIEAICPIHGIFSCNVYEHLNHKRGCKKCADIERGIKQRNTTEDFIKKAREIHGNKYDYSKVNYINNHTKVIIICSEHGEFEQTPNSHLNGSGCPECANKNKGINQYGFCYKKLTKNEIIQRAKEVHGDKYIYTEIKDEINNKIKIICPIHGEFWQTLNKHITCKQGCPKCRYVINADKCRMTTEEFITKAKEVHGDKYDYSKVVYKGYEIPIIIGCPIHGWFETTPDSHLHSGGCGKCGVTLSKKEDEIVNFLRNKLCKKEIKTRVRNIIKPYELDIYLPDYKLAIEYNGVLWHSEKYGKGCNYHLNKLEECNSQGINLIQIFEDEYLEHKDIVLNKLQHLIGIKLNKDKIRGNKCIIKEINVNESRDFLNKFHIQGFVRATIHLGAFYKDKLIGVMSFSNLRKNNSEYELVRFASDYDYVCYGVGGKLFKYFVKNYNPTYIKSFADRRWTMNKDNNLYTKLGFKFKTFTNPDYTYFCKKFSNIKRIHKFNFRKAILIKKFPEYNFNMCMTENEMCEKLNAYKIWNCGLIKYEWTKN